MSVLESNTTGGALGEHALPPKSEIRNPISNRVLIAGIGNIFHGDDAFGCEVAKQLVQMDWPDNVRVTDFGIRSYDLAYAIMVGYDLTILVDATQQGDAPGTVFLIEPDLAELDVLEGAVVNSHSLNPLLVLQLVRSLGGDLNRLLVVGCEPEELEPKKGQLGLSAVVRAAIPKAITMIQTLVADLLDESPSSRLKEAPIELER